ncbi:MAG: T9SS type A sorting domain-containing protein, partial [Flavobacteriales bacterium]|nr:T9SS type A sorting domain-containing protein [Flavobacteriales bacterium]
VTVTATYKDLPPTFTLTVVDGISTDDSGVEGWKIYIQADGVAGKIFDKWTVEPADVVLDDANAVLTFLRMPASDVTVTANFLAVPQLTVINGTSDQPEGAVKEGTLVTITAEDPAEGMKFDKWLASEGVTLADPTKLETTFTMPGVAVEVTATYIEEEAPKFTLTVTRGSGSGDYEENEVVDIIAEDAPTDQVFDAWTGDVTGITDVNAATTTITMPASAATIVATYKTDPDLAIADEFNSSFNVYPNPVNNGVLNIQTLGNGSTFVTITNLVGQEVFTAEFSGKSTKVSTSSFNKGLYFVTLKSGNNVSTKRVVIE